MTDWNAKALALLEDIRERTDRLDAMLKERHLFAYNAVTIAAGAPVPPTVVTMPSPAPAAAADRPNGHGGATVTQLPRPTQPRPGGSAVRASRQLAEIPF